MVLVSMFSTDLIGKDNLLLFTANDPQWKPKEAKTPIIPAENVLLRPGTPIYKILAPPMLDRLCSNCKSILNKVTEFQIPTPNHLGARLEKNTGGGGAESARNRV